MYVYLGVQLYEHYRNRHRLVPLSFFAVVPEEEGRCPACVCRGVTGDEPQGRASGRRAAGAPA